MCSWFQVWKKVIMAGVDEAEEVLLDREGGEKREKGGKRRWRRSRRKMGVWKKRAKMVE